jgi:hypothetical protein
MDPTTQETLRAAEEATNRLVEATAKGGRLYKRYPRAVAQVSRTAKWLLNALAVLRRDLDRPPDDHRPAA